MPFSIAFAGKGGTGKTTLSGMMVRYLVAKGKTPILAVDADPNANLNEVLGLDITDTLGNAREDMKHGNVPPGMTKDMFISMRMQEAIAETDGFELVVMGQPEGTGCYCAANTILSNFLEKLTDNYAYLVMDNEAGMEHISRLTTRNVDILLVVADTSMRSLQAAVRIWELSKSLNIGIEKTYLIINRVKEALPPEAQKYIEENGIHLIGTIPDDEQVYEYDLSGKATLHLPEDSPSVKAAFDIFNKFF